MNDPAGLDHCLSFINLQMNPDGYVSHGIHAPVRRAVTLSRQAGCGARVVADKLAARLQQTTPAGEPPWTVFDRNLMEAVLADHNLPARLAKFLPEDRMTELQDIVDELFGLRPASWTMIQQTSETILKLAELGNAIIIGRGGNVITAKRPNVIHVRLVAPLTARVEHATTTYGLNPRAARAFCLREDAGRRRYLRKYLKADIDDPLLYHLCLNTGLIGFEEAARLIADAVQGQGSSAGGGRSQAGNLNPNAAFAHRAEVQASQMERL
ncbi:MAG: cytidylate kinase-like family protein [Verrucomicrobiota bacterium]|nr:cytidylate kinase-like family protein [Limisphaerales bacterium]